ncbi:hypothetical protein BT69DRAFT_1333014 [Atractiella rhizophila]|nr:hypothetical protein BT69DRAFT_1333014 [Atractiella rhizophila]
MSTLSDVLRALQGQYGTQGVYSAFSKIFQAFPALGPVTFYISAPFGRYGSSFFKGSGPGFSLPGTPAWFCMEIVSPILLILSTLSPPLSTTHASDLLDPSLTRLKALPYPRVLLACLFLIHYANRAVISSFRNPSRAPMHVVVVVVALFFNTFNAFLMGSFLGGRLPVQLQGRGWGGPLGFWGGILLWAIGLAGNIVHDEILYSIRRNRPKPKEGEKRHYEVPHGFLFDKGFGGISNPAYFCEWVEWIGFAIACTSLTPYHPPTGSTAGTIFSFLATPFKRTLLPSSLAIDTSSLLSFLINSPPWLFVWAEIGTMVPRAVKTHAWYKEKFGSQMPAERKAIVPGLL